MLTRRDFLQTTTVAAAAQSQPCRIAVIAAAYLPQSHAQHMVDRFLVGYPYGGAWRRPNAKVVSLYAAQQPDGDLNASRAREFGFRIYPTIAGALRSGGRQLAVDAVLIVAEPAKYPRNEFFQQCLKVFDADGRAVPVFNDEHLSPSFEKAKAIVDASRKLRFPLLAGSFLPVTWRLPAIEMPAECEIEEALSIGGGFSDAMDFHALEALQCMVERRRGGETGVRAVQHLEGDTVWKALDAGGFSKALLGSALSRSDTPMGLTVTDGRTQDLMASGELRKLAKTPAAYCVDYQDGLRATMLMLDGAVQDFNFAARLKGGKVMSTQFLMTPAPDFTWSACLMHQAARMFETGAAPYPAERTLLVGGIVEACLGSKARGHGRVETPHLKVAYRAPRESQFAQS